MAKLRVIGGLRPDTAFEAMMRPYFDALYGRAYRLTANEADAEDLMQELCIRVYTRVDELAELENPKAWLMRVLYRLFVDFARSRRRSPLQSVESDDGDDEYARTAAADPGPEEHAEAMLQHERLQRAWRYLDGEQQLLLVLQGVEGHSLGEIEALTGIAQGTLKSRLHRARVRLGRLLDRETNVAAADVRGSNDELSRHRKSAG